MKTALANRARVRPIRFAKPAAQPAKKFICRTNTELPHETDNIEELAPLIAQALQDSMGRQTGGLVIISAEHDLKINYQLHYRVDSDGTYCNGRTMEKRTGSVAYTVGDWLFPKDQRAPFTRLSKRIAEQFTVAFVAKRMSA